MANECSSVPFDLYRRCVCLAVPISGTKDEAYENPARKHVAGPAVLAVHSLETGIRSTKSIFARPRSREQRRDNRFPRNELREQRSEEHTSELQSQFHLVW